MHTLFEEEFFQKSVKGTQNAPYMFKPTGFITVLTPPLREKQLPKQKAESGVHKFLEEQACQVSCLTQCHKLAKGIQQKKKQKTKLTTSPSWGNLR